jgi:hypothetical protein
LPGWQEVYDLQVGGTYFASSLLASITTLEVVGDAELRDVDKNVREIHYRVHRISRRMSHIFRGQDGNEYIWKLLHACEGNISIPHQRNVRFVRFFVSQLFLNDSTEIHQLQNFHDPAINPAILKILSAGKDMILMTITDLPTSHNCTLLGLIMRRIIAGGGNGEVETK